MPSAVMITVKLATGGFAGVEQATAWFTWNVNRSPEGLIEVPPEATVP